MQCTVVLGSGRQCCREAQPDSQLCGFHRSIEFRRDVRPFYLARLSADDDEALAVAAQMEGLDAEIATLRVLMRRVAGARDIEPFRRGIDTLCRILQTKHELDRRATDRLGNTLEAALESLARELEPEQLEPEGREPDRPPALAGGGGVSGFEAAASPLAAGDARPAREIEATALVSRYQGGEPEALDLLYGFLEVAILAFLLHYRAFQPPSAWSWEVLLEQSRIVLAELAEDWRPGGSFLAYFYRAFPSTIARYARHAQSGARGQRPGARREELDGPLTAARRSPTPGETLDPEPPAPSLPEGPYSAADLASLPELERQILVLRAFEGQDMVEIARQVGLDRFQVYRLYERARARLEGRQRRPDGSRSVAIRRLVQALHSAAGPHGRLPGRGWAMGAAGLKRREYDQLMGRLEGAGAIVDRSQGVPGYLVARTAAATLARVGISDEAPPSE